MKARMRVAALAAAASMVIAGLTAMPATASEPTAWATLPTASTTGVPAGTSLASMSGGTISSGGTTIANRVINGDAVFTGSNLTLRNVRVTGKVLFRGNNLVIENSEFGALSLSGTDTVRLSGVEVFGHTGSDGIHITSDSGRVRNVTITDTWIHSPKVTSTSHYDGIQVRGVDGLTLERVLVQLGSHKPQYTAALFLEDANGGNRNITVRDSRFEGGGYVFYNFALNVAIRNTTFDGGRWGHLYPRSVTFSITEFARNIDGLANPLKISGTSIVVGTSPTGTLAPTVPSWFSDIPLTHPFAANIAWLVGEGIERGGGTFRPTRAITRGEMARWIYRAAGSPAYTPPTRSPFVDVSTSHPLYREITWLASEGITGGTNTSAGLAFKPDTSVNRGTMAAFLYRASGSPSFRTPTSSAFEDVTTGHIFHKEIAWLSANRITGGYTDGTYRPGSQVHRQAMAAFLHRSAT